MRNIGFGSGEDNPVHRRCRTGFLRSSLSRKQRHSFATGPAVAVSMTLFAYRPDLGRVEGVAAAFGSRRCQETQPRNQYIERALEQPQSRDQDDQPRAHAQDPDLVKARLTQQRAGSTRCVFGGWGSCRQPSRLLSASSRSTRRTIRVRDSVGLTFARAEAGKRLRRKRLWDTPESQSAAAVGEIRRTPLSSPPVRGHWAMLADHGTRHRRR